MSDPAAGGDGQDYDAALPGEQTELAPSATETAAHTAWALDDGPEWRPPFWTAGRITGAVVGVAVVATVVAAGLVGYHLRSEPAPVATPAPSSTGTTPPSMPPAPSTPPPAPPTTVTVSPPPTVTVTTGAPPPRQISAPGPISSDGLPLAPTFLPALAPFDDEFMATLERNGFVVYDRVTGLKQAHASCSMLQAGEPPDLVSRKFMGVNPEINWQMATQFVGTVQGVYPGCFPS